MMKYITALILLFTISTTLVGQELRETDPPALKNKPFFGIAAFAAMHPKFPCDRWLRIMSSVDRPAMSVLWGTFGNDKSCVEKWFSTVQEKPHLFEIHLSNEAGRRNGRLMEGELYKKDSARDYNVRLCMNKPATRKRIKARVTSIKAFVESIKGPNTTVVLSLGLESQYSMCALNTLRKNVKKVWPYGLIWNPVNIAANPYTEALLLELHGVHPPLRGGCIANLDGVSVDVGGRDPYRPRVSPNDFRKFLQRHCHCKAVFGWTNRIQGIVGDGRFRRPRGRKFIISAGDINILGSILRRTNNKNFC
jgi:hypothetical protein